jgi:type VI secretion system protein ImpA
LPARSGDLRSRPVGQGQVGIVETRAVSHRERLLQPVSGSKPTGDNLEYDPEFAELERAARGKPARQMGSAVAPGEPPNYARVIDLASALLCRSKDLRIAVQLARAWLEEEGVVGLAAGLQLLRGLLERYGEALYPELDPEDRDATARVAALSALSTPELVSALRAAPLIVSARFGPISLRDVAIASGELLQPPNNPELDGDRIAHAFRAAEPGALEDMLEHIQLARAQLKAIEALLASSPGMPAVDFRSLERALYQASAFLRPYVEERATAARVVDSALGPPVESPPTEPPPSTARLMDTTGEREATSAVIRTRADVVYWLDQICAYYAQHEPSSPLPLLLQRCRRLVASSFLEIVRELAPDALSQIQVLTGKTED